MIRNSALRQALLTLPVLVAALLLSEFTSLDLWLQMRLYDTAAGSWLWARDEPVLHFLLYDGIKGVYVLFVLAVLAALTVARNVFRGRRSGLLIVLLSLILVPATANILKATTNVACPRALEPFGGDLPYVKLFESWPAERRPEHRMHCYPAGHASGGFALLSLYYLAGTPRRRRLAAGFGLAAGWIAGCYKMAIGDHFFSHTVVSMLLAWLIVNLVAAAVLRDGPAPEFARSPA